MTDLVTAAGPIEPATLSIGAACPRFEDLLGTDGQRHGLSDLVDRRLLVLVFSSNRCPTAKAYGERMNALQADYGSQGMQIVALNSNDPHLYPEESYAGMVRRAAEDHYAFPYLVDDGQRLARACGARCTFHVFAFDAQRHLRYEGRFDNSRITGNVTSHDLRDALDDMLKGRAVRVAATRPFGCSLDFVQ